METDQINELAEAYESFNIDFDSNKDFDKALEILKEEAADFIAKYCIVNKLDIDDIDNHDDLVTALVSYTLKYSTKALHTYIKSKVSCVDIDIDEVLDNIDESSCEDIIHDELMTAIDSEIDGSFIYYDSALEYLLKNDASLSESLELAREQNYTVEDIDSCSLARLHYYNYLLNENGHISEEIYNAIQEYTTEYDHETLLDDYLYENGE